MRKLLLVLLSIFSMASYSQDVLEPVKWDVSKNIISDNEIELIFKATIDDGWKMYSQYIILGGLEPTYFEFQESDSYERIGVVEEPASTNYFDPVWDMDVSYFKKEVIFKQKVKILKSPYSIEGEILYITCNEKECFPPPPKGFAFGSESLESSREISKDPTEALTKEDTQKESV